MKCIGQVQYYWYALNNKFTVFDEGLWDCNFGAMAHYIQEWFMFVGELMRRWFENL